VLANIHFFQVMLTFQNHVDKAIFPPLNYGGSSFEIHQMCGLSDLCSNPLATATGFIMAAV
jgi:hypothetical protein